MSVTSTRASRCGEADARVARRCRTRDGPESARHEPIGRRELDRRSATSPWPEVSTTTRRAAPGSENRAPPRGTRRDVGRAPDRHSHRSSRMPPPAVRRASAVACHDSRAADSLRRASGRRPGPRVVGELRGVDQRHLVRDGRRAGARRALVPEAVMGTLVLAAGTSVPDALDRRSRVARAGQGRHGGGQRRRLQLRHLARPASRAREGDRASSRIRDGEHDPAVALRPRLAAVLAV